MTRFATNALIGAAVMLALGLVSAWWERRKP